MRNLQKQEDVEGGEGKDETEETQETTEEQPFRTFKTQEEFNTFLEEEKKKLADTLDLSKYMVDVHGAINKVIKADYTLARLSDKDKEAVIEMTANAYMTKKLYDILKLRAKIPYYNPKTKRYEERELNNEEKKKVDEVGKRVFDTIMTRVHMTVIMNRNVDKNYLIKIIAKIQEEVEQLENQEEPKESGIMAGIKKIFKRNTAKEKMEADND